MKTATPSTLTDSLQGYRVLSDPQHEEYGRTLVLDLVATTNVLALFNSSGHKIDINPKRLSLEFDGFMPVVIPLYEELSGKYLAGLEHVVVQQGMTSVVINIQTGSATAIMQPVLLPPGDERTARLMEPADA